MKNKKELKDGGTIRNWQIHNLKYSDAMLKTIEKLYPDALREPNPIVFSGTVVDDPTGRWKPGFHMRSSLISKLDRENGIITTQNTIYKVIDEGNDILPDMGNGILEVFY